MSEQLQQQLTQLPPQQFSPYPPPASAEAADPMTLTINDTLDRLNRLRTDVTEMGNKITYLRDIRPRALALLAQADEAEAEANHIETEKSGMEKEVERLKTVVARMEDMRFSTKQLTDQMLEDTALQMRHILENGKSIVPRIPNARLSVKRSSSDDTDVGQAHLFKIPRKESNTSGDVTAAAAAIGSRPSSSATSTGSSASPVTTNFSPKRSLTLTPNSGLSNYFTFAETPRSMASSGEQSNQHQARIPTSSSVMQSQPPLMSTLSQPIQMTTSTTIATTTVPLLSGSVATQQTPLTNGSFAQAAYSTGPMFSMTTYSTSGGGGGGLSLYPPTGSSSLASALAAPPESTFLDDTSENRDTKEILYR